MIPGILVDATACHGKGNGVSITSPLIGFPGGAVQPPGPFHAERCSRFPMRRSFLVKGGWRAESTGGAIVRKPRSPRLEGSVLQCVHCLGSGTNALPPLLPGRASLSLRWHTPILQDSDQGRVDDVLAELF